ncbi:unnamed protein product [Strongylus vulgaris]|uniref:Neurotransmitter-gated ion-channel transmembrane domain-containing protein n=1 Tax=Strongylus vulgaris TaxID=40348 RepID=A0A3P7IP57_STRVU|nr:unnamed protein product [Strongylus vulgaris]
MFFCETYVSGNYSRLSAYFTFKRNLGFYLIQIYFPSSLIVVISWVSFWLNREAVQARVAIGRCHHGVDNDHIDDKHKCESSKVCLALQSC